MNSLKICLLTISLFLYSLAGFTKTLVISDIDDTIKKANSMGGIGGVYHFLRKKTYKETRDLFNEIKKNEVSQGLEISYYYVSAAPSFTFDADEWIAKNRFPKGATFLKTKENGGATYAYKYRTIKSILNKELAADPDLKVIFFGDNSQYDAKVYNDLKIEMDLNAEIFVRDVSTEATYFDSTLPVVRIPGVEYFFSEIELIDHPSFLFMSVDLKELIQSHYRKKDLIPKYTLDTLVDRLKERCDEKLVSRKCKESAKKEGSQYWDDYHNRF